MSETSKASVTRPENARILSAVLTVGAFVAVAKVVGAGKEMVVAAWFGTGHAADAYAFLLSLVSWPATAWTAAVGAIVIPALVRLRAQPAEDAQLFRREVMGVGLVAAAVVGLVSLGVIYAGLSLGYFGLAEPVADSARGMLVLMAACAPAMMIVGVLSAFLMSAENHANSLLEAVTPLVLAAVVIAAGRASAWSLALGTLLGYMAQGVASTLAQPRDARVLAPAFSMASPVWAIFWRSFWILILSQLIVAAASVIDQLMFARLGASANATLAYSNRLTSLLLALGATVSQRATLPIFSDPELKETGREWIIAQHWIRVLLAVGLLAAAAGWIVAPIGVRLLYERGTFNTADTAAVTELFRYSLLQLPFYFSGVVVARLVASNATYSVFLYGNIVSIMLKITLNIVLIPRIGLGGALVSTALVQAFSLAFLLWVSHRHYARMPSTLPT